MKNIKFGCLLILAQLAVTLALSGEPDVPILNDSSGSGLSDISENSGIESGLDDNASTIALSESGSSATEHLQETATVHTTLDKEEGTPTNTTIAYVSGTEPTNTSTAKSHSTSSQTLSTQRSTTRTSTVGVETTTITPPVLTPPRIRQDYTATKDTITITLEKTSEVENEQYNIYYQRMNRDHGQRLNVSSAGHLTNIQLQNLNAGIPYTIIINAVELVPYRTSQNTSSITAFTKPNIPDVRCHDNEKTFHLKWNMPRNIVPTRTDIFPMYTFGSQNISFFDAYNEGADIVKQEDCLDNVEVKAEAGPWISLASVQCQEVPIIPDIQISQASLNSVTLNIKNRNRECQWLQNFIYVNGAYDGQRDLSYYTIDGLQPGQKYNICVSTYIGDVTSNLSCTLNYTKPSAIRNFGALAVDTNNVTFCILNPQNESLTQIVVNNELGEETGSNSGSATCSGLCMERPDVCFNFTDLVPGSHYTLSAYTVAGPWKSEEFSAHFTTNETVPGQSGEICSKSVLPDQVTVGWNRVENPNGHILHYNISYSAWDKDRSNFQNTYYEEASDVNATLSSLPLGTCYKISVSAVNSAGQGSFSPAVLVATQELAAGAPTNLKEAYVSQTVVNVTWQPPSNYTGVIVKYVLQLITQLKVLEEVTYTRQHLCSVAPCCSAKNISSLSIASSCAEENPGVFAVPPVVGDKMIHSQKPFTENGFYSFTGLLPFTTYLVQLQAYTNAGGGPWINISLTTKPTVPGVPLQFEAVTMNATSIKLTWESPAVGSTVDKSNILYYILSYRSSEDHTSQSINISSDNYIEERPGIYEYTLSSLRFWTNYTFILTAWNSEGGGNSTEAFNHTAEYVPTSPVTDIQAISSTSTSITLQWNPPEESNGEIVQYSVNYTWEEHTCDSPRDILTDVRYTSVANITISGLEKFWMYNFQIIPWTSQGAGNVSSEVYSFQTDSDAPDEIQSSTIRVMNISTSSVNITWKDPCFTNGNISKYIIEWKSSTNDSKIKTITSTARYVIIKQLHSFSAYKVRIAATVDDKQGNFSDWVTFITAEDIPTSPVTDIQAISSTSTSITLQWNPPEESNGGIVQYSVNYTWEEHTCDWPRDILTDVRNTSVANITISGLEKFWMYNFQIIPWTSQGAGNVSSEVYSFQTDSDAPDEIQSSTISVTNISTSNVYITWEDPCFPNGNISEYIIEWKSSTNVDSKNKTITSAARYVNITQLQPYSEYEVRIAATVDDKQGNFSDWVTFITAEGVPSNPENFRATYVNSTAMYLEWSPPRHHNGIIRGYIVMYSQVQSPHMESVNLQDSDALGYTIYGLQYWTNYTFKLCAYTDAGNGNTSTAQNHTDEFVPTDKVKGFTWNATSTSITLSWQAPSQPNGHIIYHSISYTYHEHICVSGLLLHKKMLTVDFNTNDSNPQVLIENLFKSWQYTFKIKGCTVKGCGREWSEDYITKTNEDAPDKIDTKSITFITTEYSVNISWSPPCFPNGVIRKYIIKWKISGEMEGNTNQSVDTQFTLLNLLPYTKYEIKIAAETKKTGEYTEWKEVRTDIAVPFVPTNVIAKPESATSVQVSWDKPIPNPGPTNYTVSTFDKVFNQSINSGCTSADYTKITCTVENLQEFWNYTFMVKAATEKGFSLASKHSNVVTTYESTPGKVSDFNVSQESDVTKPRSITVSWQSPSLIDKNGIITGYLLRFEAPDKIQHKMVMATLTGEGTGYKLQQDAEADQNYAVTILAETKVGNGSVSIETIDIRSGAPLQPNEVLGPLVTESVDTVQNVVEEREIVVTVPLQFLCGNAQGKSNEWGVIVAGKEEASDDSQFFGTKDEYEHVLSNTYYTWAAVQRLDRILPYKATVDGWNPCRTNMRGYSKRSVDFRNFIVGADKDCKLTSGSYCNGYLKPGREYRVKMFACTDGGCTETLYSNPISTDEVKKSNKLLIAGAAVGSFVAILMLAVLFVLRRQQRLCFSVKHTDVESRELSSLAFEKKVSLDSNEVPRSCPVKVGEFSNYFNSMSADSNLRFSEEYKLIRSLSPKHCVSASELSCNRVKNRFTNILPFDQTRVKLLPLEDDEGSDYINANYIPGNKSKREYIACQGPLPFTKDDFWRMVWEQNVSVIVMLTQCVERGKVKCEQYWPNTSEPVYAGELILQMHSESTLPNYMIRVIELKLGTQIRQIKHVQFIKWPDFGCPKTTEELIEFLQAVRTHIPKNLSSPVIVHCSAGVGRTGTFISLDRLLKTLKNSESIDILGLILELREYRCNMVQTEDQYVFIHECVRDILEADSDSGEEEYDADPDAIYENVKTDPVYANY